MTGNVMHRLRGLHADSALLLDVFAGSYARVSAEVQNPGQIQGEPEILPVGEVGPGLGRTRLSHLPKLVQHHNIHRKCDFISTTVT